MINISNISNQLPYVKFAKFYNEALAAKQSNIEAVCISSFDDKKKGFDDWNCGQITKCGDFGKVCGGYGAKVKGSDIKKTFTLPAGIYSVQLDFIRVDSWFVVMLWAQSVFDSQRHNITGQEILVVNFHHADNLSLR